MMWQWLCGVLLVGSTIVLYDGSPFKKSSSRLFDLIDELGISVFGTSAKFLQSVAEMGLHPKKSHNLSSLNQIFSTGSPLYPDQFDFVYNHIKSNVLLGSITGGTDILSLFCGHNVEGDVYRGEIMTRCLGMAVEAWDDEGVVVLGSPGDLVCTKPFPIMPVFFWNDTNGSKYFDSYFSKFSDVW
jgi:acetoacetyl-CoA synthetase